MVQECPASEIIVGMCMGCRRTLHLFEQGNGGIQQFLSISQQPVSCGLHVPVHVRPVLLQPGLPAFNRLLARIGFIFQIVRCQRPVQHPHDDIQMVVLVGGQDIGQFPVKLLATRTFQPTDLEPDLSSAAQTVMA